MTESNQTIINADLNDESFENRVCPECGASLIVRSTKNGHILGCSNYPVCNYLENINLHGVKILKVLDGHKSMVINVKKRNIPIYGECLISKGSVNDKIIIWINEK